jgi:hypothetical protein
MTYETLKGTEKLEAEVKKLKMMLFQVREDREQIVDEKLALKEENETLKADKALLIETVKAGVLTVKALEFKVNEWRNRWRENYSSFDQY